MVTALADLETQSRSSLVAAGGGPARLLVLTVLSHPEARRVGDEAWLAGLAAGEPVALSRLEPAFAPPRGGAAWPLADPALSRRAATLERHPQGVRLRVPADGLKVAVAGAPLVGDRVLQAAELAEGVVLTLGRDVVLLLQDAAPPRERPATLGLVGESEAVQALRGELLRVAGAAVPVLLRGETGTGKELAAAALHRHSPRRARPWVPVSMAALSPSTALSSLFGHVRGAFTGAVADHEGCFAQADTGTLFLDEVGEAPVEVQTMLLRVLETGSFVPLGGRTTRTVDVRLLAATDADLEGMVEAGRFRSALLHRLEGYRLRVPALRERRADIGRLLYTFLREELGHFGEADRLDAPAGQGAWLPGSVAARLALHPWPGNVRELRNAARQLAIASRGQATAQADGIPAERPAAATPAPVSGRRRAGEVETPELIAALEASGWRIGAAARALGLARSSLYMLIDRCPDIRKASEVPAAEVSAAVAAAGGDLEQAAAHLRVSPRGLRLRLGAPAGPGPRDPDQ
ncbi:MAG: sigma-54-dependent Fis family transcriptional regulator [Myxococcales bacterium]|nr:sigma-54-dependent Fis family transcriptional regulator [Myxococcales bacterium]